MTKSLPISKRMVYDSYLKVVSKDGSAGIDKQSIEMFNEHLSDNLYKIWNRMTSGSYFPPPVRRVLIPKKQGGTRPLGIPTVSDRIAQGVVKEYLGNKVEPVFHPSSFGYRPGKSAHDAVRQCTQNCRSQGWVADVDIKGFFDNISHSILMQLVQLHTQEKWVMMYIERWLKAGVEQADGSIAVGTKGTPQGGVISPLLANIYLHHAFDEWMKEEHPHCPFERYADDIVIHCANKQQAEVVMEQLKGRMKLYELELQWEKTRIVYCKDYRRNDDGHDNRSFTFLGFSYQPCTLKSKREGRFLGFRPIISQLSQKQIRSEIRKVIVPRWSDTTIEKYADKLNHKMRGWVQYFGVIDIWKVRSVLEYANYLLIKWIQNKYRRFTKMAAVRKMKMMQQEQPALFYHWKIGIRF
jgi:RNA-directed DNA polymerase